LLVLRHQIIHVRLRLKTNHRSFSVGSQMKYIPNPYLICGGALVAQLSQQEPYFTSEVVGWILATDSCEKSQSTLFRKSWVFSGCSGFLPQGKLTGWVRINTVKKVISQLL
jgi:hypothetical protein